MSTPTSSSTRAIQRLSRFWVPTVGTERSKGTQEEAHDLLVRAGYVRQAHAGIFHMLIDKHMETLGMHLIVIDTVGVM
jgi:prolyl-tRNA synthetase